MKLVEPSSMTPGDDLDGLLRAFFHNQMPHPWPAPRTPRFHVVPVTRPAPSGRPLMRSRWALAASVALLLLGSLLLPGRLTPSVQPGGNSILRPEATDPERQRMKIEQEMKKFQEKHKVPDMEEGGQINALDDSDLSSLK